MTEETMNSTMTEETMNGTMTTIHVTQSMFATLVNNLFTSSFACAITRPLTVMRHWSSRNSRLMTNAIICTITAIAVTSLILVIVVLILGTPNRNSTMVGGATPYFSMVGQQFKDMHRGTMYSVIRDPTFPDQNFALEVFTAVYKGNVCSVSMIDVLDAERVFWGPDSTVLTVSLTTNNSIMMTDYTAITVELIIIKNPIPLSCISSLSAMKTVSVKGSFDDGYDTGFIESSSPGVLLLPSLFNNQQMTQISAATGALLGDISVSTNNYWLPSVFDGHQYWSQCYCGRSDYLISSVSRISVYTTQARSGISLLDSSVRGEIIFVSTRFNGVVKFDRNGTLQSFSLDPMITSIRSMTSTSDRRNLIIQTDSLLYKVSPETGMAIDVRVIGSTPHSLTTTRLGDIIGYDVSNGVQLIFFDKFY